MVFTYLHITENGRRKVNNQDTGAEAYLGPYRILIMGLFPRKSSIIDV